jgi:hypothetical protein
MQLLQQILIFQFQLILLIFQISSIDLKKKKAVVAVMQVLVFLKIFQYVSRSKAT